MPRRPGLLRAALHGFWLVADGQDQRAIGRFSGCLEIFENPDDADEDIILYARGVGRVVHSDRSGGAAIVLYRRPR
ncbi:MAG: hypothetical protein ABIP94_06745 [Planctomycetota bacterium]